jgi:diguanylate cyclase (GGDEF)-like protein/PAS domain S-box-containing protein
MMSINNSSKKFWRRNNLGYWLLCSIITGFMSWFILVFLSEQRSNMIIFNHSIVNQIKYLGLLIGLTFFLYYLLARQPKGRKQWFLPAKEALRNSRGKIMGIIGTSLNTTDHKQQDEKLCQLRKAIETMQLGVTITDMDGKIIYTNSAEARMHGYEADDLIGEDLGIFAPAELRKPMTPEQIKEMKRLRESINIRKDGSTFPVRLMSDVIKDPAGEPVAIVTTCEDISMRKQTEDVLKQRTRALALLNRMSDLLQACFSEKDTYSVVGRVCKKLFPSDSGCISIMDLSRNGLKVVEFWGNLPHPPYKSESHTNSAVRPDIPHTIEYSDTGPLCPYQNSYSDNECLCVPISTSGEILGILSLCSKQGKSRDSDNNHTHDTIKAKRMVLTRVAEHYARALVNLRLREALRMECIRDSLTGLYNRRYMEESLEREARRAKRRNSSIGIIMLDIDHFKDFNDIYGHDAGDIVLKKLGTFLHRHTRGEDIACRYGGEEFLLILPEAPLEVVMQRAKELHSGIKKLRIVYQKKPLSITISAGVAVLPDHSSNVREVVKAADEALYRAKEKGRDQIMVALTIDD